MHSWFSTCFERQTQPTYVYMYMPVCFLGGVWWTDNGCHSWDVKQTMCTTCKHVLNLPQEVYHEKAFLSIHLSNVYVTHQTLGLMQVTTAIFLSDLCFMTIYQTCKQCAHHVNIFIYLWTQAEPAPRTTARKYSHFKCDVLVSDYVCGRHQTFDASTCNYSIAIFL